MKTRKPLICSVICLVLVTLMGVAAYADTIKLRDGSVLKGKVISYNQRKFTILVYIGSTSSQHVVSVDDIESVEFDSSDASALSRVESQTANPPAVTAPPRAEAQRENLPVNQPADGGGREEPRAAPETTANDANTGPVATIVEKTVSVAAAADWTSTEIRVQRGQRIVINASGEVDLGDNHRTGPDGISITDNRKLISARPTGALIAVIGDDNDDFIFVGKSTEFVSPHNGILFLSVNEGTLKDNTGAFVAQVKVLSNR